MASHAFSRSTSLLVLAALAGPAAAQTPLRVMAGNITSGNFQDMQAPGTAILKSLKPDVAMMQEFNIPGGANDNAAVAAYVSATLGAGYNVFREPGNQSIPNAIISKYPFLETGEFDDTTLGDRDYCWARIDVPGTKDLWAISVHLKSGSATQQNTQAGQIIAAMQAKGIPVTDYVVIGGDYNTTSRNASCIGTFSGSAWSFQGGSPWPVGEDGDGDTNAGRSSPYDWVLPNNTLNAISTPTVYPATVNLGNPAKTYTSGLVFDTRDFTQSVLNEYFPFSTTSDSGASNMQHMAVVRTFLLPGVVAAPANGTVATVALSNRAASNVQSGADTPMLSAVVTVANDEWDAASFSLAELGTVADADITAKVYVDSDNSGTVTGGDQLVGTGAFSGGVATVGLNPAPRATAAAPLRLLAVASASASATSGSTVQFRATANGLASAVSGGTDPNPTYAAFDSGSTLITGDPTPPPAPTSAAVVVNKFYNQGDALNDAIELLVVQDGLDLRGMIVKDFSGSMANDGGGKFVFSTNALWASVRAGTVIILRNNATAADTSVGGSDYKLDIGLTNATYFSNGGGTLDLAGTEMVMVKAAGTGAAGVTGSLHALAAGTAGAQYTAAPAPKLLAATGTAAATPFAFANSNNGAATAPSRLSNYDAATGGAATGGGTGLTFGIGNNAANVDFITFLRGPASSAATAGPSDGSFRANWGTVVTATAYVLDVARDTAFTAFISGYNGRDVGAATGFDVTGLSDGTYYYRVRGKNVEGTVSGVSGTQSAVVTSASVKDWTLY